MIATVRRRWSTLDNALKQMLFVIACIFAILYLGAAALVVFAGSWAGVGAVSAILGITLGLAGLVWLATRLFPDSKD